jgi:hypothetical protein
MAPKTGIGGIEECVLFEDSPVGHCAKLPYAKQNLAKVCNAQLYFGFGFGA